MKMGKLSALSLGIWLILQGLIPIVHISFEGMGIIMAILAIAAGVLIILDR